MRPGYFKVDETPVSPAVIFPAPFHRHSSAVEVGRYLARAGFDSKLVYIPMAPGSEVPDLGMPD